jgi:hypothetical protein
LFVGVEGEERLNAGGAADGDPLVFTLIHVLNVGVNKAFARHYHILRNRHLEVDVVDGAFSSNAILQNVERKFLPLDGVLKLTFEEFAGVCGGFFCELYVEGLPGVSPPHTARGTRAQ